MTPKHRQSQQALTTALEKELAELTRTDPDVRAAQEQYDAAIERLLAGLPKKFRKGDPGGPGITR